MGTERVVRALVVNLVLCMLVPKLGLAAVVLGDISFDNNIGVEEAISALKTSAGEIDPNILNVASMQSAQGTYTFDVGTNYFSISLTDTNIPRSMGPPIGEDWSATAAFPDADTMNFAGISFNRQKTGTGAPVTGVWDTIIPDGGHYRLFVSSTSDAVLLIRYADYYSTLLNRKTITINGDVSDWNSDDRVYMDDDGPECGNAAGQDLQEVYMVQDDQYLYVRYKLNGSPDVDFGYKFGANLHTYAGRHEGTGDAFIMWAASVGMSLALPDSDVDISGSEIEFRVDLCQPGWDRVQLDAWLDDHNFVTGETTCSDHVELPYIYVDVSGCP